MTILDEIINDLPEGLVVDARIGVHWTAVVVEKNGTRSCGLSSTLFSREKHRAEPEVDLAGRLAGMPAHNLVNYTRDSQKPLERSLGFAALNALLNFPDGPVRDVNAEAIIAGAAAGRTAVVVGSFPFIPRLRKLAKRLEVLELHPGSDEIPATEASKVIPEANVVAITGMTFANGTLEELLSYCKPGTLTLVLGPSTPLHPILFNYGVDVLSGSLVEAIDPVLQGVSQGANFQQLHPLGVRLVSLTRPTIQAA